MVAVAHQRQVEEIHLGVGEQPRFREQGEINPTDWPRSSAEDINQMVTEVLSEAQLSSFKADNEYNGAHDFGFTRAGISLFRSPCGSFIRVRLIQPKIPAFSEGELPPEIDTLTRNSTGLILVTGAGRSGKTTTVAAMIDRLNRTAPRHILCLEDPIVYMHQSERCLIRQRDMELHTHSFAKAKRASLREDVDVIVFDEIYDHEMMTAAIEASEHGQLVIAAFQTNSFSRTVDRLLSLYIPGEHPRIRRAVRRSLLAEVTMRPVPGDPEGRHAISVNRRAYRDYRPPYQPSETSDSVQVPASDLVMAPLPRGAAKPIL